MYRTICYNIPTSADIEETTAGTSSLWACTGNDAIEESTNHPNEVVWGPLCNPYRSDPPPPPPPNSSFPSLTHQITGTQSGQLGSGSSSGGSGDHSAALQRPMPTLPMTSPAFRHRQPELAAVRRPPSTFGWRPDSRRRAGRGWSAMRQCRERRDQRTGRRAPRRRSEQAVTAAATTIT